jgi:hypothetical protein
VERGAAPASESEIAYVSTDLRHAAVFTQQGARFGPPLLVFSPVEPFSPARYFDTADGAQCISVGPPGSTVEFAIKRPIVAGEQYRCLATSFRVVRCFEGCRAAVIEIEARLDNDRGSLKSYIYAHNCLGVLVFSQNGDLAGGIPLDAEWLRGNVGILADRNHPACNSL